MLETSRNIVQTHLTSRQVCVINGVISGSDSACATPALYYNEGFELRCLIPRWSEVAYQLEENPQTMAVITLSDPSPVSSQPVTHLCWLEYRGEAKLSETSAGLESNYHPLFEGHLRSHPADYFWIVQIKPRRIDLIDSRQGWKVKETLEFF